MKIWLTVNFEKEKSFVTAEKVIELFENKAELISDKSTAEMLGNKITGVDFPEKQSDLALVIGGDGTIIHTSKTAAIENLPVLGINTGRIGYLAALDCSELEIVTEILSGNYELEERLMLDVSVKKPQETISYTAFNDAVISKGGLSRLVDIDVKLNDNNLKYRADGLILSTPTGSTAYSLSAGGPVLDSGVKAILMTPICPYAFFDKAIVVSDTSQIEISVINSENTKSYLTVDGETAIMLLNDDIVNVKKHNTTVKFVRFKNSRTSTELGIKQR